MKLRSIELTNFRKFVGTVKVDNIGDNVNVLVGRNELGKSTLLQAINGVIFEKAKSNAAPVKAFRHFVNGTVPEVKLAFDVDGRSWTIHKRYAGQAGKSLLTCSDHRIFEDEAAETELQRLLGFAGGRGGGEPGIWGTLWVQQGKSFGGAELDDQAQRTMQGCLEAQIGLVTGGTRGQKIPRVVREALEELRSARGPRGKYKSAIDRLDEIKGKIAEFEAKRKDVFELMEDLARNKRELKDVQTGWDESARRAELDGERTKRTAAATRAAEIKSARNVASLALERAANTRQKATDRAEAIAELELLEAKLAELTAEYGVALSERANIRSSLNAAEAKLADLRAGASRNANRTRELERIRTAVSLSGEIKQHQATLDKLATFEKEAARLSEMIGAIAATGEAAIRIEQATTELAAADAAMNAVATWVAFAIEKSAQKRVVVNEEELKAPSSSLAILGRTVIAIEEVGTITVEPQIKNRDALLVRRENANSEMNAALEAAGVRDLASARVAAAQRKEHERRLAEIKREMTNLTPANRSKKILSGLEPLKTHLSELRGRLQAEMEKLSLATLSDEAQLAGDIERNHEEGTRLAAEIGAAEAEVVGPQALFSQADKKLCGAQERLAGLRGTVDTKKADLAARRASCSDSQLTANAEALECDAAGAEEQLARMEASQGESVEAIDARIKRLENAASNHRRSLTTLGSEVTRLTTLIEANEGAGVEELLLAAEAERDRLIDVVKQFEEETAVLQLLLDTLEAAESEAKNRYLAPVVARVEPYLKMLLPGANILLKEDLRIAAIQRDGQREEFDTLSGGTQEQLAVLTRIAFAELLRGQGRPATVILDDALAFSDDDRIESMFDVLMRAGDKVQIIVLTCRRRLFTRLGALPLEIKRAG